MADLSLIFDILAVDRASRVLQNIGKAGGGVGTAVGNGTQLAAIEITKFAVSSIKAGADFDATIRQVASVAGVPKPELKQLSDLALKFGADTKFSAGEAADAILELAKGGLTTADIKAGALKETLTLAAAGGIDLAEAATAVSNGLNTFGLKARDAGQVTAALAGGANASSASVESLTQALAQVGPGAKNAGLSVQETTAALSAFANAGIQGSDAGTSLKTFLQRLVPATDSARTAFFQYGLASISAQKASEIFAQAGVKPLSNSQDDLTAALFKAEAKLHGVKENSTEATKAFGALIKSGAVTQNAFTNVDGSFKSLSEISQVLKDKIGGLSAEQKSQALTTLFGSDATRAATVLANEGATGLAKYIRATSDSAAANRVAAAATQGTKGALEQLKGSFETLQIQAGLALGPIVTQAALLGAAFLNDVVPALHLVGTALQPVIDLAQNTVFQSIAVGAGAFALVLNASAIAGGLASAALSAYIGVASFGIGLFSALTGAAASFNAVLLANPFVAVAALIIGLAAALVFAYKRSETFRNIVNGVFDSVKDVASGFADFFTSTIPAAFTTVRTAISTALTATKAFFVGTFTSVRDFVTRTMTEIYDRFRIPLDLIVAVFRLEFTIIKGIFEVEFAVIKAIIVTAFAAYKLVITTAFDAIKAVASAALGALTAVFSAGLAAIQAVFGPPLAAIKTAVSAAFGFLSTLTTTGMAAIRSGVSSGLSTLSSLFSGPFETARGAVSTKITAVVGLVSGIGGKLLSATANFGGLLVNAGRELMSGLARGITERINAVTQKVRDAVQKIKDLLPGSPVKTGPLRSWNNGGAGKRLMGLLQDGIVAGTGGVQTALRGAVDVGDLAGMRLGSPSFVQDRLGIAAQDGSVGGGLDQIVAELRETREDNRRLQDRLVALQRTGAM